MGLDNKGVFFPQFWGCMGLIWLSEVISEQAGRNARRQKCWQTGRLVGRQGLNDDCTMKKICRPSAGKFLCVICVIV